MGGYGSPEDDVQASIDLNDNAIHDVRERLPDPDKEYLECVDCGDEIPEARRKAIPGCPRCVACQELIDKLPRRKVKLLDKLT